MVKYILYKQSQMSSSSSADPEPSTQPYHFPPESIRVYAETQNAAVVGEEVARELAEDVTFRYAHAPEVTEVMSKRRSICPQS